MHNSEFLFHGARNTLAVGRCTDPFPGRYGIQPARTSRAYQPPAWARAAVQSAQHLLRGDEGGSRSVKGGRWIERASRTFWGRRGQDVGEILFLYVHLHISSPFRAYKTSIIIIKREKFINREYHFIRSHDGI